MCGHETTHDEGRYNETVPLARVLSDVLAKVRAKSFGDDLVREVELRMKTEVGEHNQITGAGGFFGGSEVRAIKDFLTREFDAKCKRPGMARLTTPDSDEPPLVPDYMPVAKIFRLSANAKIEPCVVEAIPVDVIHHESGGRGRNQAVHCNARAAGAAIRIPTLTQAGARVRAPLAGGKRLIVLVIDERDQTA